MWFKTQNSGPIKLNFANLNERFAAMLGNMSPQQCSCLAVMCVKALAGAVISYEPIVWVLLKIRNFLSVAFNNVSVVLFDYRN